jgi:hypothetical protein
MITLFCSGPCPSLRNHTSALEHGWEDLAYEGPQIQQPNKFSGIKGVTWFRLLELFDVIWDFPPDMMHGPTGFLVRHLFALFKEKRTPSRPHAPKNPTDKAAKQIYQQKLKYYEEVVKKVKATAVSKKTRDLLDDRCAYLAGDSKWMPNGMRIMQNTGRLKSIDSIRMVLGPIFYLLGDLYLDEDNPRPEIQKTLNGVLEAMHQCLTMHCDAVDSSGLTVSVDSRRRAMGARKIFIVERLCDFEAYFPDSELSPVNHDLIHVPNSVYRWNSVRNFWAFFNERYIKWVTDYIHNKKDATENMVRGYCRTMLMRSAPHKIVASARRHCILKEVPMSKTSCLLTVADILKNRGGTSGESQIVVNTESRSNNMGKKKAQQMFTLPGIKEALRRYNTGLRRSQEILTLDLLQNRALAKITRVKRFTMDGRKWTAGKVHCEYNLDLSNKNVATGRCVAKLIATYHIEYDDQELLILLVERRLTLGELEGTYSHVLTTAAYADKNEALTCITDGEVQWMSKLVPHYKDRNKLFSIRMFPARSNADDLNLDVRRV